MINHARALLLNREGEIVPAGAYLAEEYVPVYSPLILEGGLKNTRAMLFGEAPDYDGLLYRTAQYMAVLHSTEFVEYVTALDPRITYTPRESGLADQEYGVFVTSDSTAELTVLEEWKEPSHTGRVRNRWTVRALGSNLVQITHVHTGEVTTATLVFDANGGSSRFNLCGSDFQAVITKQDALTDDRWNIAYLQRPSYDLGEILASLQLMSGVMDRELFGTGTVEPYKTFRNLFRNHRALPFQLSGVLLALIYRMEEMRNP